MKRSMIIVAGGSGTRMGADLPKQFIELNGKPVLMHTIESLHSFDPQMQLVLVLPEDQMNFWEKLRNRHDWHIPLLLANGGVTRFLSVKSGLERVEGQVVGVHDGVRPFISKEVVNTCFDAAEQHGAAVPVVPIVQSLRMLKGTVSEAVDRNQYRAVQTPQCFQTNVLKDAFEKAGRTDYSDDATVVESQGGQIRLVDGDAENIKITTPLDLELAQLIIARRRC